MNIGVPKETFPGERRVALIPAAVNALKKLGATLSVETSAGAGAGYRDSDYQHAGATIVGTRSALFQSAQIIAQVRTLGANSPGSAADVSLLRSGQLVVAQCDPLGEPDSFRAAAKTGAAFFSLELVPRIARAQSMDVLSSMATIAGYKAVLLAADHLPQMFPMMMTAAGTLPPARVFVIGAGVAGLQAIATARRLGGVVSAFDVRPAVKEQCESLGARFVEMDLQGSEGKGGYAQEMGEEFYRRQRQSMSKVVSTSDVVISTAAIPGKKAPVLMTTEMVQSMPAGSVIVDLAAERGGNCELTRAGQTVEAHNVTILGPLNIASEVPRHASQMFSNNVLSFLKLLIKDGKLTLKLKDDVIAETLVTRDGRIVHPRIREMCGLGSLDDEIKASAPPPPVVPESASETYRLAGS